MPQRVLAITTCRVSSVEQLQSNSLNRQQQAVIGAAESLGATIPDDGQWSGSVSSKAGNNIHRKDLREMIEYCRKHRNVKYLIVDEVDRFMRSMRELFYFEVEFEKLGVKVWYATQPELNSEDHNARLLKALEVFKAEGTNVERQTKSIKGQVDALKEGRYPFAPKPGYKRGYERGVQEIHPVRGPILSKILINIAARRITPTEGLKQLNDSEFMNKHSNYRMDKFRKIITDPFYAGIVEVDKQVKYRNENGLHTPLITKDQHIELIKIMNAKKKTQTGPRKNGNPKYPLSNEVSCDHCKDKPNGRIVGFDHGNGKPNSPVYEKYRCRVCKRYQKRDELHSKIEQLFASIALSPEGRECLLRALDTVWTKQEGQAAQEANRLRHKVYTLRTTIRTQVDAALDPANAEIKEDILASVQNKKQEVAKLEDRLTHLTDEADQDKRQFLQFAFEFIERMGPKYLELSKENRLRCKQVVFPAGFRINEKNRVYTPEISPLYTLAIKKKDAEAPLNSHLVRVKGL